MLGADLFPDETVFIGQDFLGENFCTRLLHNICRFKGFGNIIEIRNRMDFL